MAKATKKQALGRGLSALLKDPENDIKSAEDKNADKVVGNIIELELKSIDVNPFQPRTSFNDETLRELATSIKEIGVIQPITVRKLDFDKYQLVSGERRYRAAKIAGLETVPAYIRIANDNESLTMALVENIQRQDLDPIEIALSYQRLIDEISLTQEQLSDRVGKKRSTIANYLRLLKLDPIVQTGIRDGFISMGHGRALINVQDQQQQLDIYEKIIGDSLSVRNTESLVRSLNNKEEEVETKTVKEKSTKQVPRHIAKGIKDFSEYFGAKIDVKVSDRGSGKLIIPFSSEEDFKRLKKLISSED
ncbi:ParB/RepB/Spo0J family partition protein [Aquimarina sp. 2201CG5-10]|uniref:ParB/RepB/Spo0J family partition protein n=1 Tax=Aquimarina callyspongiae TaxID=3098150 RepID=UPI002AB3DDBD|nr:ParB/RepB/Spo0J family partition protein [Aquimarina sp. 2201CG5-10]MDY8137641.1 ParB/RepB/Spo0J family partition protein [Aquimarina sp. 2201CG5-10]